MTSKHEGYVEIRVRMPFNFHALLGYLKARAMVGVEQVALNRYQRAVRVEGELGILSIDFSRADRGVLLVKPATSQSHASVALAAGVTSPSVDVTPIEEHLALDLRLQGVVEMQAGLRVPGTTDPFELAVRAILGQQVSVARAAALAAALAARFGYQLPLPSGSITTAFPDAATLAGAPIEDLGVPRTRADAIRCLSKLVAQDQLLLGPGLNSDERQATVDALLRIRGIGPWTASYVALRALGDGDALAVGDLGLRQAMGTENGPASVFELNAMAESWRPWRGYAAAHIWTTLLSRIPA
jgi:3-methyladenine DNA glycosylase/8-oxoguanine DNA glycosylase